MAEVYDLGSPEEERMHFDDAKPSEEELGIAYSFVPEAYRPICLALAPIAWEALAARTRTFRDATLRHLYADYDLSTFPDASGHYAAFHYFMISRALVRSLGDRAARYVLQGVLAVVDSRDGALLLRSSGFVIKAVSAFETTEERIGRRAKIDVREIFLGDDWDVTGLLLSSVFVGTLTRNPVPELLLDDVTSRFMGETYAYLLGVIETLRQEMRFEPEVVAREEAQAFALPEAEADAAAAFQDAGARIVEGLSDVDMQNWNLQTYETLNPDRPYEPPVLQTQPWVREVPGESVLEQAEHAARTNERQAARTRRDLIICYLWLPLLYFIYMERYLLSSLPASYGGNPTAFFSSVDARFLASSLVSLFLAHFLQTLPAFLARFAVLRNPFRRAWTALLLALPFGWAGVVLKRYVLPLFERVPLVVSGIDGPPLAGISSLSLLAVLGTFLLLRCGIGVYLPWKRSAEEE